MSQCCPVGTYGTGPAGDLRVACSCGDGCECVCLDCICARSHDWCMCGSAMDDHGSWEESNHSPLSERDYVAARTSPPG